MRGLEVTLGSGVGPLECACPELEWLPASRQSSHRKEGSPAPPGGCPRRTRCSLRDKDVIKLLVLLDVSACPGLVGGVRVPGRMEASGQSPFHMFCPKGKPLPLPPRSCQALPFPCPLPFVLGAVTGPPWYWLWREESKPRSLGRRPLLLGGRGFAGRGQTDPYRTRPEAATAPQRP